MKSYVHSLEERVAYLETKLQEHGVRDGDLATSPPTSAEFSPTTSTSVLAPAERSTINQILDLGRRSAAPEPAFSTILLTELMQSKAASRLSTSNNNDSSLGEKALSVDMIVGLDDSPVSLPTREGAQALVRAYFQFANQSLPLLHEPTFRQKLECIYSMPRTIDLVKTHTTTEAKIAVFFVFGVFAVALLILQKQDPSRIPTSLADRYHRIALKALNEAGLPPRLETVQAILLVAQYSYHHPTAWAVWKTVGAALCLAVEIGLHQDPPEGEVDVLTLDTMRRTFWVAYAMDRNVSIALGLPSSLADGAITAKFPTQVNDNFITPQGISIDEDTAPRPKRVSLHVFRYRQIQSEMRTMLYETQPAACGVVDLDLWQKGMHERIQNWYNDTPRRESLTVRERKNLENFELTYHRALFYLYHPSRNIPCPLAPALVTVMDAATSMIRLYRRFFTEHRLTILWQAVENLFSAGTALMYSYVNSVVIRERISLHELESLVHTCSSVLWGMVEHFPDFKGKRDAFDMVVSKTFADLNTNYPDSTNHLGGASVSSNSGTGLLSGTNNSVDIEFTAAGIEDQVPDGPNQLVQASQHDLAGDFPFEGAGMQYQPAQMPPGGSDAARPQQAFSFTDFDDVTFDWDAFGELDGLAADGWP